MAFSGSALSRFLAASPRLDLRLSNRGKLTRKYAFLATAVVVVAVFLYVYDPESFPITKTLLAVQLVIVCLYPTFRYFSEAKLYPPIFQLTCLSYAYQFAVPIFTRYPQIEVMQGTAGLLNGDVIAAEVLSLLGACALITGYYILGNPRIRTRLPEVHLPLNKTKATIHCAIILLLFPILSRVAPSIQEQLPETQSIFNLLDNQLLVAIGIMSWLVYSAVKAKLFHKIILVLLVTLQFFVGVSSTVLEQPLVGICIVLIFKWTYTRRLPVALLIAVMFVIFFLQPVKVDVRGENWYGQSAQSDTSIQKATRWVSRAGEFWLDALSGNSPISDSTSNTFYRSDFIHQFAYIHALTPSVVPYQYGRTYSFFLVSFVPRILWPEKPVTKANAFFGVTYGITSEEGAERSNFGVSLVGESFINFGIAGVILLMTIQGAILKLIESMFGGPNSGAGGQAVLLSCSIWFLNGVGSSAEIMFAGILQNLLAGCALLLWARSRHSVVSSKTEKPTEVHAPA